MKNIFSIACCCLMSAATFAATGVPGKTANHTQLSKSKSAAHDAVIICHKGREITVDAHAVPAHLAHGDKVGSCTSTPPGDIDPK
ncbi:hypothetical protein [Hymenobacter agri]